MKKTYLTEQKRILIDFLEENQNKQFTIKQIAESLDSFSIGKSTVYRLINNLCNDGLVLRISKDNSPTQVYQFLGDCKRHSHLHLKCMDCGTLIHLENSLSEQLNSDIFKKCEFELDSNKTMIVGRCKNCFATKENKS